MAYRRQETIYSMLLDCARPSEIKKYEELLQTNKGSGTIFALRVIKRKWDEIFHGKAVSKVVEDIRNEESYNGIKIKYWDIKDTN